MEVVLAAAGADGPDDCPPVPVHAAPGALA